MAAESVGFSALVGMGAVVAGTLAIGVVIGLVVDSVAGTAPAFLFVGLALGIVGAVSYTVTKFRQYLIVGNPSTTDENGHNQ